MAAMQSPQHPLEVLPAMLNLVLIQTAKILRDPECHNPKQAGLTKMRITKIVTVANQRFHDALDEIEVEILRAKAIMERDLQLILQKRVERDRANGITLDPSPPKETEGTAVAEVKEAGESMLIDDRGDQAEAVNAMTEPGADPSAQGLEEAKEKMPEEANQVAVSTDQGMPQDSADSLGLAITMPPEVILEPQEKPKDPEKKPTEPASAAAAAAEVPLDMSEAVDFDFASMFNDADMTGAEDAVNFDFGLSADPAMDQDILNDSNFENMNVSNANNLDETVPLPPNEDIINSVLPGLENYLNADTDFSNISIPAAAAPGQTSQAPVVSSEQTVASTGPPAQNPGDSAPAETSFDNFFGDFDMGGTDDLGDATVGDLDDFDWS